FIEGQPHYRRHDRREDSQMSDHGQATPSSRTQPDRFTDQTVIVTGAGSGIGRATALRIVQEGGRVITVDISAERLADLAAAADARGVTTVVADITDDDDIARIVRVAGERIDALANVAGVMDDMTPVGEVSDAVWQRVFAVNVDAVMKLMRAVIPVMAKSARGAVVNVASEASLRGSA